MNESPKLLRAEEVAARIGQGRTTVYALIKSGELESVKIGRSRRVTDGALIRYIERLEAASRREAS